MLKDLKLEHVYDSADYNLIRDLQVPLLKNSISYLRGVGFFTSGWIRLAAQGLTELLENGGNARIVTAPILEESDWNAFKLGEEAKCNKALKEILKRNIDDLALSLELDTLNSIAWMISDGLLEFRFAISRDKDSYGDYHDKVGVFTDSKGDTVAIHGSFNDSVKGSLNGEAFSVFKSWDDGQIPFVNQHKKRLTELWESGNSQFKTFTIPEIVHDKFIRLRTSSDRPYKIKSNSHLIINKSIGQLCCDANLRPYQEEAIYSWISSGCKGIFEMATGTGKTITALGAAQNRYEVKKRLALVILVPYLHLVEQWESECHKVGFNPVLCSSAYAKWHIKVKSKIQDYNIKALDHICIISVHATAASDKFSNATKDLIPDSTMIIGDEVHSLGSPVLQNAMIHNANCRLGLSATPRRWFDDTGTDTIFSYFGQICFEFSLENAIKENYLTPYKYMPELVCLTKEEMEDYEILTNKIGQLERIPNCEDNNKDESLKILYIKRSNLMASAEEKLKRLITLLEGIIKKSKKEKRNVDHILVYCAPGTHLQVIRAIANLGLRCHEFVHTVSLNKRHEILEQFDRGDIQVIVSIKCLDEGVDLPSTRTAFLLASTSNPREFVQRRGRTLRLAEGKSEAMIYDFIIVPRQENLLQKRAIDANILKKELPRFAEMSASAVNEFESQEKIIKLLNHYELINLIDEKPWELYNKLKENNENYL